MTTKIRPSTLADTAVAAGSYGAVNAFPVITTDAQGRVTYAASATANVANTQITGQFTSSQIATTVTNYLVPANTIIMWSGASTAIPSGWNLCDGTLGTPDLRDRFVIGAGNSYAVGATGGSKDASVVDHTHTGSASSSSTFTGDALAGHNHITTDNGHTHSYPGYVQNFMYYSGGGGNAGIGFSMLAAGTTGSKTASSNMSVNNASAGTPSGTVSTSTSVTLQNAGVDGTGKNMPPYYALCFIMKSNN